MKISGSHKKGFKTHAMRVTTSSAEMTWRTPKHVLDLVTEVAGHIDLDPCAAANEALQFAHTNYTGDPLDGLKEPWTGRVAYCNPPYGRALHLWIRKAVKEATSERGPKHTIILVPARVDTRWFQDDLLPYATAICFYKGRIKFGGKATAPAPFPSLIAYIGPKPIRFRKVFARHGWVFTNPVTNIIEES